MISLLECDNGDLEKSLTGLAPYLRGLLDNGVRRALWMHAEQVHLEHVLGATVGDEDSAAGQVIEHAFADPETIDMELLALSPGLMVVGAKAVLPFSLGALAALREARTRALGEAQEQLGCADLARACARTLPAQAREALSEPKWSRGASDEEVSASSRLNAEGHLFQGFSDAAKRSLVRACRSAHGNGDRCITPLGLLLAALEEDAPLRSACGWSPGQVRSALGGQTPPEPPPPDRALPPSPALAALLTRLPAGADSLDFLAACLVDAEQELAVCFERHRITTELVERARSAFQDPPGPAPESVC